MDNEQNEQRDDTSMNPDADFSPNAGESQGERIKARAKRLASEAQDKVGGQVREEIESGRRRAAGTLDGVAQSLISSAEENEGIAGRYIERAGHQVQRLSEYLESTDVQQIMTQTENFARRQPLLFLGGAFALGLVAARFIKSSQRAEVSSFDDDDRREQRSFQGDRERPVPGFREDDMSSRSYGDMGDSSNLGMRGNTGMGSEANPPSTRGSATGTPAYGTPAGTGMTGTPPSGGSNPAANNPSIGNAPGGQPLSAAGRDFTDVNPTGTTDSLQAGGTATPPRPETKRPGSSSESDRH